jgi:hypothetical protein
MLEMSENFDLNLHDRSYTGCIQRMYHTKFVNKQSDYSEAFQ